MSDRCFPARSRERRAAAPPGGIPLALIVLLSACAAPAREPRASTLEQVRARAIDADELERALALADVAPLALARPRATDDPAADDFWHACAFAFHPDVRAARRRFLAARELRASASAPGPIDVGLKASDLGGSQRETELEATFDVLGILGIGAARAARELADVDALLALAELESSLWSARFAVDRARVGAAAARAQVAALDDLAERARASFVRAEILERNGRLGAADAALAKAVQRKLASEAARARIDRLRERKELAISAGLPPDRAELDAPRDEHERLADTEVIAPWVDEADLLASLPALRAMRLWCAQAEARLRAELAGRYPTLRLGPQMVFAPGETMPGALLGSMLSFPGSLDGRVRAALQQCERMHDAVEDELVLRTNALAEARARAAELERDLRENVAPSLASARDSWRAAHARFQSDPERLGEHAGALEALIEAEVATIDARMRLALARLDVAEAAGPSAKPSAHAQAIEEPR